MAAATVRMDAHLLIIFVQPLLERATSRWPRCFYGRSRVKCCFLDEFTKGTAVLPMGFMPQRKTRQQAENSGTPTESGARQPRICKVHPRPPRSTSTNGQCSKCPF